MIKYFYLVEFKYLVSKEYESHFDLGVFSTKKNAKKKVESCISLKGFSDYKINNFKIIKFGVHFDGDIKNMSNIILYCVTHKYEIKNNEFTYWNIFDYLSTIEKANEKIEYLRLHSRIGKKYPNNFEIIEIKVDNYNSWSEGFEELDKI